MASSDLSSIPLGATPVSGDRLYTSQGGNSRAITVDQVRAFADKLDAVLAPIVTDDSAAGFRVGSVWVDVTADRSYRCVDASVGAAIWREESGPLKNLTATAAPTVNDDAATGGFAAGSVWVDVTNDRSYRCVDASTGAAVWLLETIAPDVLVVRILADLPAPVANVITLPANTMVLIEGAIVLNAGDFIDVSVGTFLRGRNLTQDSIVGNNATQVIRFLARGASINLLTIQQDGAGHAVELNFSASHFFDRCLIRGIVHCALGTSFQFVNGFISRGGLLFDSAFGGTVTCQNMSFVHTLAGQVAVDFAVGGSSNRFTLDLVTISTVAGSFGLRMDNQNQVIEGIVEKVRFLGAGTLTSGVDQKSNNWQFRNNIGVGDSADNGISRTSPGVGAAGTVALTVNVWTPVSDGGVNLIYVLGAVAEKFTLNNANTGELLYNGVSPRVFFIQGLIALENAAAGQNVIEVGLDKNGSGTPDPDSIHLIEIEPSRFQQILMPLFPIELTLGDRVVILIRNVTNSEDVDVAISTQTVTS